MKNMSLRIVKENIYQTDQNKEKSENQQQINLLKNMVEIMAIDNEVIHSKLKEKNNELEKIKKILNIK